MSTTCAGIFQLVVDAAANGAYDNFPNNILGDGITSGTQLFLCICDDCSIPTAITQSATFDDSSTNGLLSFFLKKFLIFVKMLFIFLSPFFLV